MSNTIAQIERLQAQLKVEQETLTILQSCKPLADLMADHKIRFYTMLNKPLYTCVAWVTIEATQKLLIDPNFAELSSLRVNTLAGSGFWRYTSIPETDQAVANVLSKDSGFEAHIINEACQEINTTGSKIKFFIIINDQPVQIMLDFSYQSREFKPQFLQQNTRYTKNGRNGLEYLGVNGVSDTKNYTVYNYGTIQHLIDNQKGF